MSVRALCDAACKLGMDPGLGHTLALYDGVLAADADALQVVAWAQAVAEELQGDAEAEERAAAAAGRDERSEIGEERLWKVDEREEMSRVMEEVARVDERRRTLEEIGEGQALVQPSLKMDEEHSRRTLEGLLTVLCML